jgi:hypothetical protein
MDIGNLIEGWPAYPKPFSDEYIASYLYRLGDKNCSGINRLLTSSQRRDIIFGDYLQNQQLILNTMLFYL